MTKQEEIRNYFKDGLGNVWADGRDGKGVDLNILADNILNHLHSLDVVIKVEGELPKHSLDLELGLDGILCQATLNAVRDAGYGAFEPLIKGSD